jgi:hypothetical protein
MGSGCYGPQLVGSNNKLRKDVIISDNRFASNVTKNIANKVYLVEGLLLSKNNMNIKTFR